VTASKFYESLMSYGQTFLKQEDVKTVMSLLANHSWNAPVEDCRPIRDNICRVLNVPLPQLNKSPESLTTKIMTPKVPTV